MQSRRDMLKAGSVGLASVAGLSGCLGGDGTTTVSILTWTGWEMVQEDIEEKLDGIELDISFADGSAEMFSTVNAGGGEEYDIAAPNNEYVPRFIDADLATPVDTDIVTNYSDLYSQFQDYAETQYAEGSDIYGLPAQTGWYTYAYDSSVLPEDHQHSWEVMVSEEYEGVDLSNGLAIFDGYFKAIMLAGLALGYDEAFEGEEITFSEDQLGAIEETLIEHKNNVTFNHSAEALTQDYQQGNLVANYANRETHLRIIDNGFDNLELAVPEEGRFNWFEGALVTQGSENKEAAWQVLNEYIDPEIGATWAEERLKLSTSEAVQENLSGDRYDVSQETLDNMIPFKISSDDEAWLDVWDRVKAA